jgi:hypothetical protein
MGECAAVKLLSVLIGRPRRQIKQRRDEMPKDVMDPEILDSRRKGVERLLLF